MMDLTQDELLVIQMGLDLMVRDEGKALAQTGVSGLIPGALSERFFVIHSAHQKITDLVREVQAKNQDQGQEEGDTPGVLD